MQLPTTRCLVLAICVSALLGGAARAETRVEGARDLIGTAPLARPPLVLVYDFHLAGAETADPELVRTARQGAASLSQQIVEDLGKADRVRAARGCDDVRHVGQRRPDVDQHLFGGCDRGHIFALACAAIGVW